MEMEQLVALCKRRGFLFQSSEIYGGLNGFWDMDAGRGTEAEHPRGMGGGIWSLGTTELDVPAGPPSAYEMTGLDCTIIMHPQIWEMLGPLRLVHRFHGRLQGVQISLSN